MLCLVFKKKNVQFPNKKVLTYGPKCDTTNSPFKTMVESLYVRIAAIQQVLALCFFLSQLTGGKIIAGKKGKITIFVEFYNSENNHYMN